MYLISSTTCKLIDFLSESLGISKNKAKELIDQQRVFVNNKMIWISSFSLKPHDKIFILPPKNNQFEILYEDQNFLIVSKGPNTIVDNHKNSLENLLKNKLNMNLKAVHRIDKDTTGIVIFAKNLEVFEKLKQNWNNVEKTYYCISIGQANFKYKEINLPIDNKKAISEVVLISKNNGLSLFKVRTLTGRKHQIRIHLKYLGFPILGDYVYGPKIQPLKVNRQMLHAYKIHFDFEGKKITVKAPLPDDMKKIIETNRLNEYGF